MIRTLVLLGALACGALASQLPAFSQQYLQRLAGQVDALAEVVRDFDASALAAGLGREEALSQMTGTPFLSERQADMRATFARHARLGDDLLALRAASPLKRLAMPWRLTDRATARAAWSDFEPAVPLSAAGAVAGGGGFLGGLLALWGAVAVLRMPFRRRAEPAPLPARGTRAEPVLRRQPRAPKVVALHGVRRDSGSGRL